MNQKQTVSLIIAIAVPLVFLLVLLAIFSFPMMLLCVLLLVIAVAVIKTKLPDHYDMVFGSLRKPKEDVPQQGPRSQTANKHINPQKAHMTLIEVNASNRKSVVIQSNSFTIGRDASCDHVLDNRRVSHCHLIITYNEADRLCYVIDQSTNGTYLNSERLRKNQRHVLKQGDILQVANIAYTVEYANY